jgi:hypothetical protein
MNQLDSLKVLFCGENGKSIIGHVVKIGLCGALVALQHNSRTPEMGESGNIMMTVGNGKEKSVVMAWGQIGEHGDDYVELFFQNVDENSQSLLQNIVNEQRAADDTVAA